MISRLTRYAIVAIGVLIITGGAVASPIVFCKDGVFSGNPAIDLVADGCISGEGNAYPDGGDGFYDNAGGGDSLADVERAILHATGIAVSLTLYGKSDSDPILFTFLPDADPTSTQSGTWEVLDGTLISYITVKAANSFALYELAAPASSGTYTTLGILTNGGQQPNVSHMSFWTTGEEPPGQGDIPEPSTYVLMGAGLLALGALKKRM